MKKIVKITLLLVFMTILSLTFSQNVFADSDVFDKLLTDGKLVVHSVKPTSISTAWAVVYENTIEPVDDDYYLDWSSSFNEDFTTCTIYYGNYNPEDPSREVEISYVYDEKVKESIDTYAAKIDDIDGFALTEIDFINYLMNETEDSSMANYSSELKKAIDYKNFSIDVRMGDGSPFYTEKGGNAIFAYDNTVYYIKEMTSAYAKHIIYVDTDTTDVLAAIKARLNKIFGTDFNIEEAGTVASFLESERQSFIENYAQYSWVQQTYSSAEEYADEMMNNAYYDEDGWYSFVTGADIYENYYKLTINDEDVTFLAAKDSSKVNDDVELITSDVGSDVTISAKTALIPLDTLIQVLKITNGEEYTRLVELLKVTNSETFDLKLYSSSIGEYITELPNGTFEVKIPVNESMEGKDLVAYYVDVDNNITTYQVTIKDGYAIFTTDHFSVYTLAEKTETEETPATNEPTNTTNNEENTITENTINNEEAKAENTIRENTINNEETKTEDKEKTSDNPKTGDNIYIYIAIAFISILGFIKTTTKKDNK